MGLLRIRAENRQVWAEIRTLDWCLQAAFVGLGAWISLHHFDAIGSHAVEHHEETLVFAFRGDPQPGPLHLLEVHPLLLSIYTGVGRIAGPHMAVFVGLALLLGGLGSLFAGIAAQLLSRRAWVGWALALLLAVHPALAYWRVQGFHVAPPHAAFCATLLAAVLAARKPDAINLGAWLILGGFTLSFRLELGGAVAATALIPLMCSGKPWWRKVRAWLPGLLLSSLLLGPTILSQLRAVSEREDYWTGLRFLPIHLGVPELFAPISYLPLLLALAVALPVLVLLGGREERRGGAALFFAAVLGLFPAICFSGFGPRHLLPTTTLLLLLLAWALALTSSTPGKRSRCLALGIAALLCWGGARAWTDLQDMSERYGIDPEFVPALPGTARPSGPLKIEPNLCYSYSGSARICNDWRLCLPPKDLRDPVRVRQRWEESPGGCILWAIDDREDDVRGVSHETWMVLRRLYDWEPVGVEVYVEPGGLERRTEVYSLRRKP